MDGFNSEFLAEMSQDVNREQNVANVLAFPLPMFDKQPRFT